MNILYCGDSNIERGLIISILSILKHNRDEKHFYVLTMSHLDFKPVSDKCIKILKAKIVSNNPKSTIKKIDITKEFHDDPPTANIDTFFTPYCMLRVYADLVDLPDKILYLDNDVVALGDIRELYQTDISENEYAGVLDYYGKHLYRERLKWTYINSGVLLMNLKKMREDKMLQYCRQMCATEKMLLPDQIALNKLPENKLIIDRKFNEQHKTRKDTVLRHFSNTFSFFPKFRVNKIKPWKIDELHDILHEHQFDDVLEDYQKLWHKMENSI